MSSSKTGIDYLDMYWNFYTGCNHWKNPEICPLGADCWAWSMAHRFGKSFEPTLHPEKLLDPLRRRKPAKRGVCFTGDIGGSWVDPEKYIEERYSLGRLSEDGTSLKKSVINVMVSTPQHTYFILTKQPANIVKWGKWPDNCFVGATACNYKMFTKARMELYRTEAKYRWISFEPLESPIEDIRGFPLSDLTGISWIVIGGFSGGKNPPKIEWIKEIVDAADDANIPVFLKDNLLPLFWVNGQKGHTYFPPWSTHNGGFRQQLPKGVV